jgi:hypothetical protein
MAAKLAASPSPSIRRMDEKWEIDHGYPKK